ncbi:MAG TPA: hypothetical protein VH518_04405 [Tepidisphaeraceae bacterium]
MVLIYVTPSASRAADAQTTPADTRAAGTMPMAPEKLAPGCGEYFLDGYVRRSDVYTVPAEGITLSQAIAAAGGLEEDDAMIYVVRENEVGKFGAIVKGKWTELAITPAAELQLKHRDLIRIYSLKTMQLWPYAAAVDRPATLPELLNGRAQLKAQVERAGRNEHTLGLLKSTESKIREQVKLFAKPDVVVDFDELGRRVDQLIQNDPELQKSMAVLAAQQRDQQRIRQLNLMGSESRIMHNATAAQRSTREQIQKRLIGLLGNG